jgi:hypothetical protein
MGTHHRGGSYRTGGCHPCKSLAHHTSTPFTLSAHPSPQDRTAPALCLSPSIITSRIANQMLSDTTLQPSTDKKKSRKRPLNSGEKEAIRRQRERQERYMHIGDESYDQPFAPTSVNSQSSHMNVSPLHSKPCHTQCRY